MTDALAAAAPEAAPAAPGPAIESALTGDLSGSGVPSSWNSYAVKDLPHGFEFDELSKDPQLAAWLQDAHAKGMTNDQVQHVLGGLANHLHGGEELEQKECIGQLRELWPSEAKFSHEMKNVGIAARGLCRKAGIDYAQFSETYGNEPAVLRLLAAIGQEMREDTSASQDAGSVGLGGFEQQLQALYAQTAALSPHERDKKLAINQQIVRLHERQLAALKREER